MWRHNQTWPERFETTLEVIDALWGIEIHNEVNRSAEGFNYSDSSGEHGYKRVNGEFVEVGRGWPHALRLFTEDLSNRFNNHRNRRIRALPLAGNALTKGAYSTMQAYEEANNWYSRDYVDFGNVHEYRRARPESVGTSIPRNTIYKRLPLISTETGYSSDSGAPTFQVDEHIQEFYNMRSLFALYRKGLKRIYLFSVFRPQDHVTGYGLLKYNYNRTGLAKKQQFVGIRDMITLLKGGHLGFANKTIDYSITAPDLTNFAGDVVLQRSDGTVFVVFWDSRNHWDFNTKRRINQDVRQITFRLNTAGYSRAEVYKPATNGTRATKRVDNPTGREFNVLADGHPVFVKLIP